MSKHALIRAVGAAVLAQAIWGAGPAWAGGMSSDLAKQADLFPSSLTMKRVIVRCSPGTNLNSVASKVLGVKDKVFRRVTGGALRVPYCNLKKLAGLSGIEWVSPDRQVRAMWDEDTAAVGADQVWVAPGKKGTGIRVAVLDTGVFSNTGEWNRVGGAGSRIAGWADMVNSQATPYDDNGHGTHVAGIVLGAGAASDGRFTGTAPDADLVAVKVMGADGSGNASTVISGIEWCIENKEALGIRVINLSLGTPPGESYTTDPLCAAARAAVDAGIVVVCSAGNFGRDEFGVTLYSGITSPANDPSVITVGAANTFETVARTDDGVCTFSSRGPTAIDNLTKPDLVAPGNRIVSVRSPGSTLDVSYPEMIVAPSEYGSMATEASYTCLSGTSMASPQVAGTVALMLQTNPLLEPDVVKGLLMYSAQKLSLTDALGAPLSQGLSNLTQGAGLLNAPGAVEIAGLVDTTAPLGSAWLSGAPSGQSTIGGATFFWRNQILYGDQEVWGGELLGVRQVIWGSGVTWGGQVVWGQQVIWGDDGKVAAQPVWSASLAFAVPALNINTLIHGD